MLEVLGGKVAGGLFYSATIVIQTWNPTWRPYGNGGGWGQICG